MERSHVRARRGEGASARCVMLGIVCSAPRSGARRLPTAFVPGSGQTWRRGHPLTIPVQSATCAAPHPGSCEDLRYAPLGQAATFPLVDAHHAAFFAVTAAAWHRPGPCPGRALAGRSPTATPPRGSPHTRARHRRGSAGRPRRAPAGGQAKFSGSAAAMARRRSRPSIHRLTEYHGSALRSEISCSMRTTAAVNASMSAITCPRRRRAAAGRRRGPRPSRTTSRRRGPPCSQPDRSGSPRVMWQGSVLV
jgi:hypothetical protein